MVKLRVMLGLILIKSIKFNQINFNTNNLDIVWNQKPKEG